MSRGRGVEGARSRTGAGPGAGDVAARVERWFGASMRDLPWRVTPRDPYLSLVSEFMLQQTQVVRVLEKFSAFIERFPTLRELADAPEQDVLAEWSGLGYYRRARLLHGAARAIAERHASEVPREPGALRSLPGIGRYTAGAIASIVFNKPEPVVDGNVARVLLRIHARDASADDPRAAAWAWERATELAKAATSPAAVNEGLMELGAVVCTARAPRCETCPLASLCVARRRGLQERIPRPKAAGARRAMAMECVLVSDPRGRVLMQQRPGSGMWASMWQVPTLERDDAPAAAARAREQIGRWLGLGSLRRIDGFEHTTSHRDVAVRVWRAGGMPTAGLARTDRLRWKTPSAIAGLGISNLQRRVLAHLPGRAG